MGSEMCIRDSDTVARIEVEPQDFALVIEENFRSEVSQYFKTIGYSYVTVDLDGFRSGSLNEILAGINKK